MRAHDQRQLELTSILLAGSLTRVVDGNTCYPKQELVDRCYNVVVGLVGSDSDKAALK